MELGYVIVSVSAPADGEVIDAFARGDIIRQLVFCLSSEGQLMPSAAFHSRETSWCLKQLRNQNAVLLYAGGSVARLAGSRWQGDKLPRVTCLEVRRAGTHTQWYAEADVPNGAHLECSLLPKNSSCTAQ